MQSFSNAHADQAMQCAIEMHQWVLDQWQEQRDILKVFPLRIGINTGSAFVGNVCDKNRIEYSIVGKTVNFAQRYESACAPFHILIGEKTYHYLSDEEITRNCIDKKISVKHIQKKITAKELDPFKLNPGSEASTRLDDFREQALSNLTKGVKDAA
jgi:class 3 adenylate cyclase